MRGLGSRWRQATWKPRGLQASGSEWSFLSFPARPVYGGDVGFAEKKGAAGATLRRRPCWEPLSQPLAGVPRAL